MVLGKLANHLQKNETRTLSNTLRSDQKEVGKNIKDKKRDKRGRDGVLSREGNVKKREVSKHKEIFSLPNLC